MRMDTPIGVFDSGLGGLTVVRHLRRLLPGAGIVYFGDTARVPYGSKSRESVTRFSRESCRFLLGQGVGRIVVACNTSSALALEALRAEFAVPLHDVIVTGARTAAELTRSGRIGVIGTHATVRSGAYERALKALDPSLSVHQRACPLFVPLAEEGWLDRPATVEIARDYLLPLGDPGIDVWILGCTHYPVLAATTRLVMGDGVALVDSGRSCAEAVRRGAGAHPPPGRAGRVRYFVSDMPERFREIGRVFMGAEIGDVTVVSPGGGVR